MLYMICCSNKEGGTDESKWSKEYCISKPMFNIGVFNTEFFIIPKRFTNNIGNMENGTTFIHSHSVHRLLCI